MDLFNLMNVSVEAVLGRQSLEDLYKLSKLKCPIQAKYLKEVILTKLDAIEYEIELNDLWLIGMYLYIF